MVTIYKHCVCCSGSWFCAFQFAINYAVSVSVCIVIPYNNGIQFSNDIFIGVYTSYIVNYRIGYNQ